MKLETALNNIEQLSPKTFNKEQKEVAKAILNNAKNEYEIEQFYKLIVQKVKLGFRFDESPIRPNGKISILKESRNIEGINLDQKNTKEHKLIIGENYDALKHLQITHKGKIDIIYIDPPYNTEALVMYRDKFSRTGWLNMMKERLELARELLNDQGAIFVSIDDAEQAYLKVLMDEIFGEENFIETFLWNKNSGGSLLSNFTRKDFEYILCFAKSKKELFNKKFIGIKVDEKGDSSLINKINSSRKLRFPALSVEFKNISDGIIEKSLFDDLELHDSIVIKNNLNQNEFYITSNFKWTQEYLEKELQSKTKIISKTNNLRLRYLKPTPENNFVIPKKSISKDEGVHFSSKGTSELESILGQNEFNYPKPTSLIKYLIKLTNKSPNIEILDFFAGSGTTGHAVMELNKEDGGNRNFILVTNEEGGIALNITYERFHRIIKGQGTEGETDFKWIEKNEPYKNNSLRIFELFNKPIKLNTKMPSIKEDLIIEYQKLNPNLANDELNEDNLYNKLASLKQYEEVKDETD